MKKLLRKVLATVLAVSMTMTSISVTNINVKAAASATATNADVTMEDNTKKAFGGKDGDLYNYIKYGVNTSSDDGVEDGRDASKAVDGSTDTRWANSNHTNGHWIQIDLKQSYSVSKIGISWEVASSIDYKIEISNDGRSYKEVSRVKISDYTDPKNRVDTVALSNAVSARYVKITDVGDSYLADSGNNRRYGVSIWEIGIFGSEAKASVESTISDTGVFTKKTNNTGEAFSDILNDQYYNYVRNNGVSATASGEENSSTPISGAIDNDANTRWYNPSGDDTYYTVDLGATYSVEKVYLSWEQANATVYNIYKSENGTDYSLVTTVYNSEAYDSDSYARVDKIEFSAVNARYIKIQAVQRTYKKSGYNGGQYNGISLYEVGIYGNEQEKSYSKKAFEEFSVGNKETVGNKIEAENTDSRADGVKDDDNSSASGRKNIGGLSDGKWVQYNINFDRMTSRIYLRYSGNENSAGKIDVYVDDSTMSGTPVATINVSSTGNWSTYTDISGEVSIPAGNHKIYLKFTTDTGKNYVCNLDYFQFEYKPENANIKHEAEKAHAYVRGTAGNKVSKESSDKYSNGAAIGKMNTYMEHDRSYLTTYVKAANAGYYNMKIKYSGTMTTSLQYRINNGSWNTCDITDVGSSWDEVKSVDVNAELKQGINKIDISGAVWVWKGGEHGREDNNNVWDEWLNIDCFTLEYSEDVKLAFSGVLDTTLKGNKIQAEAFSKSSGDITVEGENDSYVDGTNLGGLRNGKWAEYNVFFDRKVSKIYLRNSVKNGDGGKVEIYVDDSSMSGTPVATVQTTGTGSDWTTYVDTSENISIPSGNHEIYLKFVADGSKGACNLDYFQFEYEPETVSDSNDKHEAENAHAYIQGDADSEHNIQEDNAFSNGKAVGGMNAWPDNGRAYLTSYVDVKHAGKYKLIVAYASGSSKDTNIDCRINSTGNSSWTSISAPVTGGWTTVKTISTEVTLNKGVNVIDITGASNIPYSESNSWQQANVDYFKLERVTDKDNLAFGKPVEASGSQTDFGAENAVDEDEDTRWGSGESGDKGYFIIDLEKLYEIEKVSIMFEKAYPDDFQILVSRDKVNWTVARTIRGFKTTDTDKLKYESDGVCLGKARYVKVRCIKMAYHNAMSIRDIRVYGTAVKGELSDLSVGKDVKVSSSDNGATTSNPKNAVDGKDDTRWAAPKEDANPWYQIDLGKQCAIDSVDLKFERAYAKSFKIQISNDGKTWTDYRTVTDWTEPGDADEIQKDAYYANLELGNSIHMDNVKTRYVRLYTDEKVRGGSWGLSLYEFEVWGKETDKTDYWTSQSKKNYGIYPISALQDTEKAGMIDSSLVQDDVIGTGDTYDVVYEANKDLYFYVNPRELYYNASKHTIYWSSGNSGDELRGAESHDEGIVSYKKQQQATVQYKLPANLDFGDKDYVETQIGCQIFETADLNKESPSAKFSLVYKVRVWKSAIIIEDKLSENGSLCVKNPESGCTYEWQKSSDGETWTDVAKKRYDLEILGNSKDGITNDIVHVAEDLGGGKYYRVRKSGTTQWSHSYKVQYYNNIQNGDFEYPAMFSTDEDGKIFPFNSNGDEQQYPNGYEGLMWKTTAPGWTNGPNSNRVGHDIEIVNGRKLKTSGEKEQVSQFSVTQDEMYKNNVHGDQFAELNCENVGALYQDILTTPNSQCYWDLDYAGRWCQNSMYVVAMSAKDAKNYTTAEQIKALISRDDVKAIETNQEGTTGTTLTLSDGVTATMWKVTSKKNAGEWNDHNGIYNAPSGDKNYITRFFFVSAGGAKRNESDTANETVGSLLDNVTFEQRQSYTIEYYVDGQKQDNLTVNGTVNPYDRVAVPSPSEVSELTLYQAKISGENDADSKDFYVDENDRNMTVAYNHNVLKLYYKSGIVVATVKVEGLDTIPDGYTIVAKLKDKSGNILQSKTINQSDFVKIEKAQGGEASGYFKTVTFEGANLTNQNQYTVEEEIVSNNYLPYYLEKVNKNGTEEEVGISHINGTNLAYTAEFTYSSAKGNSVEFINIYNPIRKVTIKKNVSGNMAEKDKNFNFTIAIEKDGEARDAAKLPDTGLTKTETGKYTFSLKHSEEIELYVYNNCKVTVTEDDYSKKDVDTNIYSDEYYKTSWVINQGDSTDGREVTVNKVTGDTVLSCTNTYNDLGDVEVQGFQMNGNKDKGGVSEYSPSFRVVCRVSKNTIKGKKVKKFGVVYAIKGETVGKDREQLEKLMTKEGASGNSNVKVHEETPNGVYAEWSTKDGSEFSTKYWSYYGLTFKCLSYMFDTLEEKVTVRAYAEMADGKIEYGNNIYTVDMYEIAKHLYSNQKMSTLKGHRFLYDNVLNLVDMQHNRAGIAKAMMKTLNVTSTSSKYYNLLNTVYRDMNDFIYCQNSYKGKYSQREEFYSENLTEEQNKELLDALNNARGTTYTDLNQWIYNEVEKIGNYKGYYRKVQYEWNGGIYIRK